MNILDEIVEFKKIEVADRLKVKPFKQLEQSAYFTRETSSLVTHLRRSEDVGIIAEFKRQSPSKGVLNSSATIKETTTGYVQGGASGLSVLTDQKYFGGSNDDLLEARKFNSCPILRKDFVIDEYQIIEAKSIGADAVLLIAAVLTKKEVTRLSSLASQLGLEVILEIHKEIELDKISPNVDVVGVNNRNLKTFETDITISKELSVKIPSNFLKISESGIYDADGLLDLKAYGYLGFLIGERFMINERPEVECREFIQNVKSKLMGNGA